VYNLEVGQWHNFLVGKSGVVVHNGPCKVSFEEFVNTVDDFKPGGSKEHLAQEAYDLFKSGVEKKEWKKLETFFKQHEVNPAGGGKVWPPNNGGFNDELVNFKKGQKFDRFQEKVYGHDGQIPELVGSHTAPKLNGKAYTYEQRALKAAEKENALYYEIEILEDLPFGGQSADVIPWFGQKGLGKQTKFDLPKGANGRDIPWNKLASEGKVKITILDAPSGTYKDFIGAVLKK
jgi:hypothetical protein